MHPVVRRAHPARLLRDRLSGSRALTSSTPSKLSAACP
jgi:hypothetical protein